MGNFRQARQGMSRSHEALIRQLPCCISLHTPAGTVHHLKSNEAAKERGVSLRATDQWGLPMSPEAHELIERLGSRREVAWFMARGVDPHALARSLWAATGDLPAMTAIVVEHVMRGRGI